MMKLGDAKEIMSNINLSCCNKNLLSCTDSGSIIGSCEPFEDSEDIGNHLLKAFDNHSDRLFKSSDIMSAVFMQHMEDDDYELLYDCNGAHSHRVMYQTGFKVGSESTIEQLIKIIGRDLVCNRMEEYFGENALRPDKNLVSEIEMLISEA